MSRSSSDRIKPQASSHCPSAGSSNAPSLGSAAADDWPKTGNVSTTRPSPSCASPPSASCCENYAIPHDVLGSVITVASANAPNVKALVFVDAFAPDAGESVQSELASAPQSLASRRQRPNQAKVRSTIQRLGSATKPAV